MKKTIAILASLFLAATAFVAPTATAAPTSQELKGTWVGTYGGFEGSGKAKGGQQRMVITAVHGGVAKGYWQSRHVGDKWSKKTPMHLTSYFTSSYDGKSEYYIAGTDLYGTYVGKLAENGELVLSYTQVDHRQLNLQIVARITYSRPEPTTCALGISVVEQMIIGITTFVTAPNSPGNATMTGH
jgi:hypothetical protein